jgi:hypothetical protein
MQERQRPALSELGDKYGTDKVSAHHTNYGRTYLQVYEPYFAPIRDCPINFLELGVLNGGSLNVWREYFPNARVIGVDINPFTRNFATAAIRVEILSQDDTVGLRRLAHEIGGFDVVLDDASHVNSLTIASFAILWPLLRPGGYYIIENTGCSYNPAELDWPGMSFTAALGVDFNNRRGDFERFIIETLRALDADANRMAFFHYYRDTIVMQKKPA